MEESKQFGKYAGGLLIDPYYPTSCSESDLFILIASFINAVNRMENSKSAIFFPKNESAKYKNALDYCMLQTRRYGVEIEEPQMNEPVEATKSFWAWFNWWNEFFFNDPTYSRLGEYYARYLKIEDNSDIRPEGDWREAQ